MCLEDIMKYLESMEIYQSGLENYFDFHDKEDYPFNVIYNFGITDINFGDITILYGNNGSGKSTLLNLIGEKIGVSRKTEMYKHVKYPVDGGSYIPMDDILKYCNISLVLNEYGREQTELPRIRKLITSDDIFKEKNNTIEANTRRAKEMQEQVLRKKEILKEAEDEGFQYRSLKDYERMMEIKEAETYSDIKYALKHTTGRSVKLDSNGETSLKYLDYAFENDGIYLLDEPENCLSPQFQLELIKIIEEVSRYCGCQFIIATHSPLILGIDNARIYNLDSHPVEICKWSDLENVRLYYSFFKSRESEFK